MESAFNVCTWNRYAVSFSLLQEMLKLRNLYEQIEKTLSVSVRKNIIYPYLLSKLIFIIIIF